MACHHFFHCVYQMIKSIQVFLLTSPTALVKVWMILSCGVATTLCPFISMIRCPTRMPPLSAMPPRIRLQICHRDGGGDVSKWYPSRWVFISSECFWSMRVKPLWKKKIYKSCKCTYNAVLHTKTQLKRGMRPPDNRHGDWRTVDDTQLNILLTFQVLKYKHNINCI